MKEVYALYAKHNGKEEFLGCASSFSKLKKYFSIKVISNFVTLYF